MTDGGAFFHQFIEDYYAECDEHLATSRRVLIELEGAGQAAPEPRLLRELFRSLHTLKGLSGMVGDACAERVAHALEGSLRAAEAARAPLDAPFVDALFAGADLLERCIAARQAGAPSPDPTEALAALARVAPAPPPASGHRPAAAEPAAAVADRAGPTAEARAGDAVYHFEFMPTVALAQRGVGVDVVRERLRELGELLDARPRMVEGGVAFDFRVAVAPGREPDPAWAADGLRWAAAAPAVPAAEPAPAPAVAAVVPGASAVRVDLARLDGVMRLVGDLVVSRSRLDDLLQRATAGDVAAVRDALDETNAVMERQLRRLRESVMRIRLVPIGEVFERLRFAARDAIRESGKQVGLSFHGQTTEIDKLVVDRMLEPLLHLVRNAVSHGIERPEERVARGKPAEGRLTLGAMAAGDRIVVEVMDDGAGIDVASVAARARARGLLQPDEALTPDRLLDVLCAPGLSTRDEADMTSGRGVGMDVVRAAVRALAGDLTVDTTPDGGTRFRIELPLTLMIVDALLVDVGGEQMAVPQPTLREILQIDTAAIVRFERNEAIAYRDRMLPLVPLARLFGWAGAGASAAYVLVVGTDAAPVGLVVDRLLGLREIVVHPVPDPLVSVPGVSGATELGDGRVSLILDPAAIIRLAHARREQPVASDRAGASGTPFRERRANA